MDVKSDVIHGDLSEEIFMEQPLGFVTNSTMDFLLKKSLYGLKPASRAWYTKIKIFFL
jgi:hypothetical protein